MAICNDSPLPPWTQATTHLFFVPRDLPFLDNSYKWSHTIRGLWRLVSLPEHVLRLAHLAAHLIPLHGWVVVHFIGAPQILDLWVVHGVFEGLNKILCEK
jgi:hypothetical protein